MTGGPRIVVVGGGISGLASAYYLTRSLPGAAVTVLEKGAEAGGTARSDPVEGYTVDQGPNGFLTNIPDSLELARAVGLEEELLPATEAARYRLLYRDGALRPLPRSPGEFLRSDLLSLGGKARVALEPFVARLPAGEDESVHRFAERRLGREFADAFIAPMVLGITAGDARETSLAALLPRMKRLEEEHGGLFRGLLARRRSARDETGPRGGPAGPGGRLTSFRRGGVQRLVWALHRHLDSSVRTDSEVVRVSPAPQGARYRVELAGGETVPADVLVMATPAFITAGLLADLLPEVVPDLTAIPYTGVRVLGLGYVRAAVPHPLDGFGFLVPREQGVRMLGCLWTSTLFPSQAPSGKVLLRVIAGGVWDPAFVQLEDEEALRAVRNDLARTMGIEAAPEMVHHVRWERAIPQYRLGHGERVTRIMAAAARRPGLLLTGNAYHGISLNDCVRDARRLAERVANAEADGRLASVNSLP